LSPRKPVVALRGREVPLVLFSAQLGGYGCLIVDVNSLINRYQKAEAVGRSLVPNRAIQAFGLEAFSAVGYPFEIEDESELWRYHDVMQDGRLELNLRLLESVHEFDHWELAERAASAIQQFGIRRFGFASAGKDMLTRALYQYALLCAVLDGKPRPWSILEVGPGCGYLGLLIGLEGHRYIALEASQAFYIYQSTLYRDVFAEEYCDGLANEADARISHLTWWNFCREGSQLPKLTGATANHMLAEMHSGALRFLVRSLHSSQDVGFSLVADTLGSQAVNAHSDVLRQITACGFSATQIKPDQAWIFTSALGEGKISYWPVSLPKKVRAKLSSRPLGRKLIAFLDRAMAPKSDNRKGELRGSSSRKVREVVLGFPDFDSADLRFQKGTW